MRSVRFATAMLPCLVLFAACSETPVARGRGGSGGSGGSAFDTGTLPSDTSSDDASADADDASDGSAALEDTTLDDSSNDAAAGDTAIDDTTVADTAVEDTMTPDTTPADTGAVDTTPADTGTVDTTPADTGTVDTTPTETGTVDTTPTDTGTVDTTPTDTGSVDTTPPGYICGSAPTYTGQVGGLFAPAGGNPLPVLSRSAFTYGNANLSNVALQFPVVDGVIATLDAPISVIGAVVVATSYLSSAAVPASQSNFWVADRFGSIEVRLDFTNAANVPPFPIQVGQRLNFTVSAVNSYQGMGQIQAASNWTLVSSGAGVHLLERTNSLVTSDDLSELVRVEGTITGGGAACGGTSRCFDLSYGTGNIVTLRTASTAAAIGQCVTFVGPVRQFAGSLQLDAINFDWLATVL